MPRIAGIDPGQPLDAEREMVVGIGPIHDPPAVARAVARGESEAPVVLRQVGIFDADEMELCAG